MDQQDRARRLRERAKRLSKGRSLVRGPQYRAAGETYIQVSNIYQADGGHTI